MVYDINIAIINASTVLTDAQLQAVIPALQMQIDQDFAPVWGVGANLSFIPSSAIPTAGVWWIAVLDNSDVAGVLGYHDLTKDGLPLGKVFAGTDLQNGLSWTVTLSHELLEMLADPDIDLTAFIQADPTTGTLYAYEVADACEADQFGYQIDGITVSDFVYPSWWETFRDPTTTQFDHQKKVAKPLEILAGGYIGAFNVTAGSGWTQILGEQIPAQRNPQGAPGSRRERRYRPRNTWQRSNPKPVKSV